MAKKLVRVPIGDGSDDFIVVEVDTRQFGDGVQLTADDRPDVATAPYSLAGSMRRVMPALSAVLTGFRQSHHAPDEVSMELGLSIGGETGLIFVKGTAEATFTVTATWKKPTAGVTNGS